jgi:hypothetical protein
MLVVFFSSRSLKPNLLNETWVLGVTDLFVVVERPSFGVSTLPGLEELDILISSTLLNEEAFGGGGDSFIPNVNVFLLIFFFL